MSEASLHVLEDPAAAVGDAIAEQVARGGSIVLTGGRTPGRAYERAAELQPDWSGVEVWWGDERCVPPDDERSNYRLAKQTLLDRLGKGPAAVHRIRGELQPADAAGEYDRALEGVELDLLLLGVGADGHIASLFPGSPQLEVDDARVTSGPAGLEPWVDRVTLTVPELLTARRTVVLVTGAEKEEVVVSAFRGAITRDVPASLLREGSGPLDVFLDPAAGGRTGL